MSDIKVGPDGTGGYRYEKNGKISRTQYANAASARFAAGGYPGARLVVGSPNRFVVTFPAGEFGMAIEITDLTTGTTRHLSVTDLAELTQKREDSNDE